MTGIRLIGEFGLTRSTSGTVLLVSSANERIVLTVPKSENVGGFVVNISSLSSTGCDRIESRALTAVRNDRA